MLRLDEQGLEGGGGQRRDVPYAVDNTAPLVEVVVDRPFLLIVRHAEAGVAYFLARIVES